MPDGSVLVRRDGSWLPVVGTGPTPQPKSDDTTGCLIQVLLIFGLIVALVILLSVYIGLSGDLPFRWADGPLGIPVWLPLVALSVFTLLAIAVPFVLSKFTRSEPTFRTQIAANRRNSIFLTLAMAGGLGLVAYVIAATVTLRTSAGLVAAGLAIAAAVLVAIISNWRGDRIVLTLSQAKPVEQGSERELTDVVTEMAAAADIPPPAIYLINDSSPNAFSIGRNPSHASIAVTTGLLSALDRQQLQGVIAHETAHIRNEDTRYALFVTVLVGSIVLIADGFFKVVTLPFQFVWEFMKALGSTGSSGGGGGTGSGSGGSWDLPSFHFGGGGGDGGGDDAGAGILVVLAIIIFVLLVIIVAWLVHLLTPIFGRLLQAAASRQREYLADATAVELGRNPQALQEALVAVSRSSEPLEVANRGTAPLYFVNPIRAFEERAKSIYSTHPPILDRINRLRQLEGEPPIDTIVGAVNAD